MCIFSAWNLEKREKYWKPEQGNNLGVGPLPVTVANEGLGRDPLLKM